MKVNFNTQILEKHVEKIVLAVALVGAGWIAYSGIQPISLPSNPDVTASTVEGKVTAAVASLKAARVHTRSLPPAELTPRLQNYVAAYERMMLHHPLPQEMVATDIPRFAPLQESIGQVSTPNGPNGSQVALAVPTVPAPKQVTAVSDRGSVLPPNTPIAAAPMDTVDQVDNIDQVPTPTPYGQPTPPPGAPGANAAPGAPGVPQGIDKTWVCVSGLFPMADFLNELNNPAVPDSQKLPPESRRAVIVKIEVQRHTRQGDVWTDWKDVRPSAVGGPRIPNIQWSALNDLDLLTTVTNLDASFQRIVEPTFYVLSTPTGTQPIIPPILKPPATTNPAVAGGVPPRPGTPGGPLMTPRWQPTPQPNMYAQNNNTPNDIDNIDVDDTGDAGAPGMNVVQTPGIPDPNQLKAQKDVPFWFYDDTVSPGQDYQYRVRVAMYNPTYRYPGPLKQPDAAKEPLIYSDWVTVTKPVSVSADLYFFVNSPVGSGPVRKVDFRVYKWTKGNWYTTEWNKEIGEEVNGPLRLVDKAPPIPQLDVDTHYRLIDIQTSQSGGEINAVLMSPTGELLTRNSRADSANNAKRNELQSKAVKPPRPKPPATRPFQRPIPGQNTNMPGDLDNLDQMDQQ